MSPLGWIAVAGAVLVIVPVVAGVLCGRFIRVVQGARRSVVREAMER